MPRRYEIYDVFTDRRSPEIRLPSCSKRRGSTSAAMQAIAREFNLSETVFVLPARIRRIRPRSASSRRRVSCPSPAIRRSATAVCLARERFGGPGEHDAVIVLEEEVGPVRCGVQLPARPASRSSTARSCRSASARRRRRKCIAARARPRAGRHRLREPRAEHLVGGHAVSFRPGARHGGARQGAAEPRRTGRAPSAMRRAFIYTRETEGHDHAFRARMFAPEIGIDEDPATGSASRRACRRRAGVRCAARRRARGDHRAGLRDGPAVADPAGDDGQAAMRGRSAACGVGRNAAVSRRPTRPGFRLRTASRRRPASLSVARSGGSR